MKSRSHPNKLTVANICCIQCFKKMKSSFSLFLALDHEYEIRLRFCCEHATVSSNVLQVQWVIDWVISNRRRKYNWFGSVCQMKAALT